MVSITKDIQQNQSTENMSKDTAFCHLQENLVINMVKNNGYCNNEIGMEAAKAASKRVVQKTAEATGDLNRNKIADKITSLGKTKSKEQDLKELLNGINIDQK